MQHQINIQHNTGKTMYSSGMPKFSLCIVSRTAPISSCDAHPDVNGCLKILCCVMGESRALRELRRRLLVDVLH